MIDVKHLVLLFAILITFNAYADDLSDAKDTYTLTKKLAEQGNAMVQTVLGLLYYNGEGVPQDYKLAVHWYTKAAEQGYASAQYSLGEMYDKGEGVPEDDKQAVHWYTKSAEQGYLDAQSNLGVMYVNGYGVLQDYVKAYMWWNIAASNGNEDAREYRDKVAGMMTPEQIAEAQELARECIKKNYKDCG